MNDLEMACLGMLFVFFVVMVFLAPFYIKNRKA